MCTFFQSRGLRFQSHCIAWFSLHLFFKIQASVDTESRRTIHNMPHGQPTFYLVHSPAMTGKRFLSMLKLGMATLDRQLCWLQASHFWALPSIPWVSRKRALLLFYRDQPLPSADSTSPVSTSLLLPSGPLHSLCLHSPIAATAPSCWLQIPILALSPLPS